MYDYLDELYAGSIAREKLKADMSSYLKGWGDGFHSGLEDILNDAMEQSRKDGYAQGKISVYHNEMKMSAKDIAKKMNKPLDEIEMIIDELD